MVSVPFYYLFMGKILGKIFLPDLSYVKVLHEVVVKKGKKKVSKKERLLNSWYKNNFTSSISQRVPASVS